MPGVFSYHFKEEEIQYDQPFEVSAYQYLDVMNLLPGICAGQEKDGKFFLKCWITEQKHKLIKILNRQLS